MLFLAAASALALCSSISWARSEERWLESRRSERSLSRSRDRLGRTTERRKRTWGGKRQF